MLNSIIFFLNITFTTAKEKSCPMVELKRFYNMVLKDYIHAYGDYMIV